MVTLKRCCLSVTLGSHWHKGHPGLRAHDRESKCRFLNLYSAKFSQAPGPDDDCHPHPFPHRRHSAEATK